ncbi:MAG: hypothetical protein J5651_06010, partial [Salinivirgaceae bacterium]|nr:hypothetical protein [Salinivirgaceae bacterium]
MKKLFNLIIASALAMTTLAAAAQSGFNYQAVIRDANGNLLANKTISLRISLMNGDNTLYIEEQTVNTDTYGVTSVVVGSGSVKVGSFASVPWSSGNISMKTEFNPDPENSSTFETVGTTRLQSVPFAEYAKKTSAVENPNKIQIAADASAADDEVLFSVKDKEGNVVFAVYNSGVRVYVDDTDDGNKAAK